MNFHEMWSASRSTNRTLPASFCLFNSLIDSNSLSMNSFLFFWPFCTAHRILVPQPGVEPVPPVVKAWILNHWTAMEVLILLLYFIYAIILSANNNFQSIYLSGLKFNASIYCFVCIFVCFYKLLQILLHKDNIELIFLKLSLVVQLRLDQNIWFS